MAPEKTLKYTFVVSMLAHGIIFFPGQRLNIPVLNRDTQKIEVRYIKNSAVSSIPARGLPAKREPLLKIPANITANNRTPPPFIQSQGSSEQVKNAALGRNRIMAGADFVKPRSTAAIRNKIALSAADPAISNNPAYISYYQLGREKIKRAAFSQNYAGGEVGEVTISFTILNDGSLKEVWVVDEKSSPSPYLREIAISSIKEASPFPGFPAALDYPQLSFNLTMTFENE